MNEVVAIAGVVVLGLLMAAVVRFRQGWRPLGFLTWLWPWDVANGPVVKGRANYANPMPPAESIDAETGVDDPRPASLLDSVSTSSYPEDGAGFVKQGALDRPLSQADSARILDGIHARIRATKLTDAQLLADLLAFWEGDPPYEEVPPTIIEWLRTPRGRELRDRLEACR